MRLTSPTKRTLHILGLTGLWVLIVASILYSFPLVLKLSISTYSRQETPSAVTQQFPVTVDPRNKIIVENDQVNALLSDPASPLAAAVGSAGSVLWIVFDWVASAIAATPLYQTVGAVDGRFVTIVPGYRKEQVATAFANALGWNSAQKKEFLTAQTSALLPLPEGSFAPGVYLVTPGTEPAAAQALVNERFTQNVLAHYGTTTAEMVPLEQALTVASLIEREASGPEDMRQISGIIWNRLFTNMNLQIDATLQYAKANDTSAKGWWPAALPSYKYLKSPYNTYQHPGLPPTPIASPSVAAILAALNPVNTDCLFYFHDRSGVFHCSATYPAHVTLLKKYYGQGK